MASQPQNERLKVQREQELDELLEVLLDAKEGFGRVGKAVRDEARVASVAILSEGARALSREADRLDPSPWHTKMWRKLKRSVS